MSYTIRCGGKLPSACARRPPIEDRFLEFPWQRGRHQVGYVTLEVFLQPHDHWCNFQWSHTLMLYPDSIPASPTAALTSSSKANSSTNQAQSKRQYRSVSLTATLTTASQTPLLRTMSSPPGFHLSGIVFPSQSNQSPIKDGFRTSVVFDRQRITSNNCTCEQTSWCQHIVALCLHRINQVCLSVLVRTASARKSTTL